MATLRKNQPDGQRSVSQAVPSSTPQIPMPQFRAFSANVQPPPTFHDNLAYHPPRRDVSLDHFGGPPPPIQYGSNSRPNSRPTTPNYQGQPPVFGSPSAYMQSPGQQYMDTLSPRQLPAPQSHTSPAILLEPAETGKKKRKSGLFGGGKLSKNKEEPGPKAWIAGEQARNPYPLEPLVNGQAVQELWRPDGNTYIYLYPQSSGKGPSFCVDASVILSSTILSRIAFGDQQTFIPGEIYHVWLPLAMRTDGVTPKAGEQNIVISSDDIELLVQARNLFAFLVGQSLLATDRNSSFFSIFLGISDLLRRYAFSNQDGSTYGDIANASFEAYVQELRLADVRSSVEKTVDMLVLGERMKSVPLYNEAYVHGVGKYEEVTDLQSSQFELISQMTRNRLEKSSIDLSIRVKNVEHKLEDFEFPGLFAGLWISKASPEAKHVKFDRWKDAYNSAKRWFMGYYRSKYGSWPPKAKPKKNGLETGGLNRLVLMDLYNDLSTLYSLLVDRKSLTTRSTDVDLPDPNTTDANIRALRHVLGEYDRSTPPVQPPIPFDTPNIPVPYFAPGADSKEVAKAFTKKYKKDDLRQLLQQGYNKDAYIRTPFLEDFYEFDYKSMEGNDLKHMAEIRYGQWCFFYAVLQSLPMLVVDAPGIQWTQGVEYFLCQPPKSGVPWAMQDKHAARSGYRVAGSDHIVYLPSDLIEHGVEGVYRRSHCWMAAMAWTAGNPILEAAAAETLPHAQLPAPPGAPMALNTDLLPQSRSPSPSPISNSNRNSMITPSYLDPLPVPPVHQDMSSIKRRSIIGLDSLEPLPLPPPIGGNGGAGSLPGSARGSPAGSPRLKPQKDMAVNPSATFDAILGTVDQGKKGKKKK